MKHSAISAATGAAAQVGHGDGADLGKSGSRELNERGGREALSTSLRLLNFC